MTVQELINALNNTEENKDECTDCPFYDTSCPGGMWCTEDD